VSAVSAQISPSVPEGVFPNTGELANVTTMDVDESLEYIKAEELGLQVAVWSTPWFETKSSPWFRCARQSFSSLNTRNHSKSTHID